MTQTIDLVTKFQPILDEVYKAASLTARMDARTKPIDFAGASVVKVFKTSIVGLGTYSRTNGYPVGEITGSWEALTLAASRGREFSIDRMDDEESLGEAFGTLAGEFIRTQVAPEVDAYRFSKYASWSGIQQVGTPATLTKDTVLTAIDTAKAALNAASVPEEGRILYVSDTVKGMIEAAVSRTLANENAVDRRVLRFDGMDLIMVPQTRFYKGITLDAGSTGTTGGYSKTVSTGRDINFMIIYPSAVLQATKHAQIKIFTPDENQDMDAYKVQYRLYHDAFVYDNKVLGIYSHIKDS